MGGQHAYRALFATRDDYYRERYNGGCLSHTLQGRIRYTRKKISVNMCSLLPCSICITTLTTATLSINFQVNRSINAQLCSDSDLNSFDALASCLKRLGYQLLMEYPTGCMLKMSWFQPPHDVMKAWDGQIIGTYIIGTSMTFSLKDLLPEKFGTGGETIVFKSRVRVENRFFEVRDPVVRFAFLTTDLKDWTAAAAVGNPGGGVRPHFVGFIVSDKDMAMTFYAKTVLRNRDGGLSQSAGTEWITILKSVLAKCKS